MSNILSLPDELLLMIVSEHVMYYSFLKEREKDYLKSSNWTLLAHLNSLEGYERSKTLLRLMRTCRRFHSLLKLELYRHPALLSNRYRKKENKKPVSLLPALESCPILNKQIQSVDTPCELAMDVLELFMLPNIKTITLEDLHDRDTAGCWNELQGGMSSVENLQLINCCANDFVLETLISLPEDLRTLKYDINLPTGDGDDGVELDFHLLNFLLWIHEEALENIVLTISKTTSIPLDVYFSAPLELSELENVKTLTISNFFLPSHAWIDIDREFYTRLPPNMEELRVIHEKDQYFGYLDREERWLTPLLENKLERFRNLRRVVAVGPAAPEDDEIEDLSSDDIARIGSIMAFRSSKEVDQLAMELSVKVEIIIS
jgi:hypothetical protein